MTYEMNGNTRSYLLGEYQQIRNTLIEYTHGSKQHLQDTEEYRLVEKEYGVLFMICNDLGLKP